MILAEVVMVKKLSKPPNRLSRVQLLRIQNGDDRNWDRALKRKFASNSLAFAHHRPVTHFDMQSLKCMWCKINFHVKSLLVELPSIDLTDFTVVVLR